MKLNQWLGAGILFAGIATATLMFQFYPLAAAMFAVLHWAIAVMLMAGVGDA